MSKYGAYIDKASEVLSNKSRRVVDLIIGMRRDHKRTDMIENYNAWLKGYAESMARYYVKLHDSFEIEAFVDQVVEEWGINT